MKDTTVLWAGVSLILVSVLFPPYGYTRYSVITMPKEASLLEKMPAELLQPNYYNVPWTYVGHKFLFGNPPLADSQLNQRYSQSTTDLLAHVARPENIAIAWHILCLEVVVIIMLTAAVIITPRIKQARLSQRIRE